MYKNKKITILGYSYDWVPEPYKTQKELHKEFLYILQKMENRKYQVEI